MNQSEHVSFLAGQYCKIVAPSVIISFIGSLHNRFGAGQGVPYIGTIVNITAGLFHLVLANILCKKYDLKFLGIAISSSL